MANDKTNQRRDEMDEMNQSGSFGSSEDEIQGETGVSIDPDAVEEDDEDTDDSLM